MTNRFLIIIGAKSLNEGWTMGSILYVDPTD
jgi:hypothetical protein